MPSYNPAIHEMLSGSISSKLNPLGLSVDYYSPNRTTPYATLKYDEMTAKEKAMHEERIRLETQEKHFAEYKPMDCLRDVAGIVLDKIITNFKTTYVLGKDDKKLVAGYFLAVLDGDKKLDRHGLKISFAICCRYLQTELSLSDDRLKCMDERCAVHWLEFIKDNNYKWGASWDGFNEGYTEYIVKKIRNSLFPSDFPDVFDELILNLVNSFDNRSVAAYFMNKNAVDEADKRLMKNNQKLSDINFTSNDERDLREHYKRLADFSPEPPPNRTRY